MLTKNNPPYLGIPKYTQQLSTDKEKEYQLAGANLASGGVNSDYTKVKDVKQFIDQEIKLDGNLRYGLTDMLNMQRLSFMAVKLEDIRQIASDLQQEVSMVRSSPLASGNDLVVRAETMLKNVNNILNSTFNGEYLYSGTSVSTASVDLSNLPIPAVTDIINPDLYYKGNYEAISFKADNNTPIKTVFNASDPGISELVTALKLATTYSSLEGKDARLAKANDLCCAAIDKLISSGSIIRQSIHTLNHTQEGLKAEEQQLTSDIKEVGYESQIEAMQDFFGAQSSLMLLKHVTIQYYQSTRDLVDRLR